MIIYLSRNRPWHATYTAESGQVLYRCEATTAFTLGNRDFSLYRTLAPSELGWKASPDLISTPPVEADTTIDASTNAINHDDIGTEPSTSHHPGQESTGEDVESEGDNTDLFLRDQFKLIGLINYNPRIVTKSTISIINDLTPSAGQSTATFFRRNKFGLYGRDHTFTASDGVEYTWKMKFSSCSLYPASSTASKNSSPIVTYTYPFLGLFRKTNPAKLEISDGYENMLDVILLTFIYVEKLRRDSEDGGRNAKPVGGS